MSQLEFYLQKLQYETDSSDLFSALEQGENIIVVDTRSKELYEQEHIPGAVSIPHRTMDEITTGELDKDKLYVTYCNGIGCNASTKGALKLAQYGFKVKELIGGIDWWKRDGYQTKGIKSQPGKEIVCGC